MAEDNDAPKRLPPSPHGQELSENTQTSGDGSAARAMTPLRDGSIGRDQTPIRDVGSIVRAHTPTLWHLRMRQMDDAAKPKQERDSLRSRSKEGRPGSRKHRRWTRSQEILSSLRKVMAKLGEDPSEIEIEKLKAQLIVEHRPSIFYKLLEQEGPAGALEAWAAAEAAPRRTRSRPRRPKTTEQVAMETERNARIVFGDSWSYVASNDAVKDMLLELEGLVSNVFSLSASATSANDDKDAKDTSCDKIENGNNTVEELTLRWDGKSFLSEHGCFPSNELAISGFDPVQRKVVHRWANLSGLVSRSCEQAENNGVDKVLRLKPPRRCSVNGNVWKLPYSLAGVLAKVAC